MKDEQTRAFAESAHRGDKSGHTYLVGTPETDATRLRGLEQQLGMGHCERRKSVIDFVTGPGAYDSINLSYYEPVIIPVIHIVDAGYQRKGMASGFYDHFRNLGHYVREEDFRMLEEFADPDYFDTTANIRKNFLENYERGRSILTSWW
ncbi:hypothetical protein AB0N05_21005 [Nocardia sp. NPDC051030]|uniref:hypothetical protein n=1 Tax=Nocardia sp. NPDC051030 TaxID=3155162 RepID=UPI0034177A75